MVERARRGHASTQNALAEYLRGIDLRPLSPIGNQPAFDIAWEYEDRLWVAEVKTLTDVNEEKQLRLALGQLLRYRQQLGGRLRVRLVLVTEREPSDPSWHELCLEENIILVWPGAWARLQITVRTGAESDAQAERAVDLSPENADS